MKYASGGSSPEAFVSRKQVLRLQKACRSVIGRVRVLLTARRLLIECSLASARLCVDARVPALQRHTRQEQIWRSANEQFRAIRPGTMGQDSGHAGPEGQGNRRGTGGVFRRLQKHHTPGSSGDASTEPAQAHSRRSRQGADGARSIDRWPKVERSTSMSRRR